MRSYFVKNIKRFTALFFLVFALGACNGSEVIVEHVFPEPTPENLRLFLQEFQKGNLGDVSAKLDPDGNFVIMQSSLDGAELLSLGPVVYNFSITRIDPEGNESVVEDSMQFFDTGMNVNSFTLDTATASLTGNFQDGTMSLPSSDYGNLYGLWFINELFTDSNDALNRLTLTLETLFGFAYNTPTTFGDLITQTLALITADTDSVKEFAFFNGQSTAMFFSMFFAQLISAADAGYVLDTNGIPLDSTQVIQPFVDIY